MRMGRKRLLSAQQVAHARKLIEQGEGAYNVASVDPETPVLIFVRLAQALTL
jgi:hypothetical protein